MPFKRKSVCHHCIDCDDYEKPPFDLSSLSISFSGCGFLGIYHIGVVSALRTFLKDSLHVVQVAGCSAGSLAAVCLLLDVSIERVTNDILEVSNAARRVFMGPFNPNFDICQRMRNSLQELLPHDAHTKVSRILHISVTDIYTGKNKIISTFVSRQELIDALIATTFIPVFSGIFPTKWRSTPVIDGGFSVNQVKLDDSTLTVSPFSGEAIISPNDQTEPGDARTLLRLYVAEMGWDLSWNNLKRLSSVLFPPSAEILAQLLMNGYMDAMQFLSSAGFATSCPTCITIKSHVQQPPDELLKDKDMNFPSVLITAAEMLLANVNGDDDQKALAAAHRLRENEWVTLLCSTISFAYKILYYTPLMFAARWTILLLAKEFTKRLITVLQHLGEAPQVQRSVEQVLGMIMGTLGPFLGFDKVWVSANDRTQIPLNEQTLQQVERRKTRFMCDIHVVSTAEADEGYQRKRRCPCKKPNKHHDNRKASSLAPEMHSENGDSSENNVAHSGLLELLSLHVEAFMEPDEVLYPTNCEEALNVQSDNLSTAAHSRFASVVPSVSASAVASRIASRTASHRGSTQASRRNSIGSIGMDVAPETLENILKVTRTQDSVLNAYYTDSNGDVVTVSLYDISQSDPCDIIGQDVLSYEHGGHVHRHVAGGNNGGRGSMHKDQCCIDPEHIHKKLQHFMPIANDDVVELEEEEEEEEEEELQTGQLLK